MLENLPPEFFPSIAEIEQGFKDVQVECRTGRKLTVRMIMPPGRQALKVSADFLANPDLYKLILACLPEQDEAFLDRLTPQSIGELFNFSYVFVQGLEQAKKKLERGAGIEERDPWRSLLEAEFRFFRRGFSPAEVRTWSLAKLNLYGRLDRRAELQENMLALNIARCGGAMEPGPGQKLFAALEREYRELSGEDGVSLAEPVSETPTSQAEFERMLRDNG